MKSILHLIAILLVLSLTACNSKDKDAPVPPVEELYSRAMDRLQKHKYKDAIDDFEEVERTYPFSPWTTRAQLMIGYAHYENVKYNDSISALDHFIKLHPGHKDVAYAYYLKALNYYDQIADVRREQSITDQARSALQEVAARFPESEYARDAKIKLDLVVDHLAGKEMDIGRYYLRQGNFIAAANRFKNVVDNFQTTTHIPEALHRLVESYVSIGVKEEAQKYAAVLGYNYPGSKWYQYSYKLLMKRGFAEEPKSKWLDISIPWFKEKKLPAKLPEPQPETESWPPKE